MIEQLNLIVETAANTFKNDIKAARDRVILEINSHQYSKAMLDEIILIGAYELVCRYRDRCNYKTRNHLPQIKTSKPKVIVGKSKSVKSVVGEWLNYYINGKTLGSLLGSELIPLATSERNKSNTHLFIADLLEHLAMRVSPDQYVQDMYDEQSLQRLVKKLQNKR